MLEVVIAMTIASISLAAFYAASGSASALVLRAQMRAQSAAIASDLIGRIDMDLPLAASSRSGVALDGEAWTLDIRPLNSWPVDGLTHESSGLYLVQVTVTPPGQAQAQTYSTFRLDRSYLR